jgi:hypothetical protein
MSWNFSFLLRIVHAIRNENIGGRAMLIAFEVNIALWMMIACGIIETAVRFY